MSKAISTIAALSAIFVCAGSTAALSDIAAVPIDDLNFPSCFDDTGKPIPYVTRDYYNSVAPDSPHIIYYAGALFLRDDPPSQPVILYNTSFIETLSPAERAFVFSHECYHQESGDAKEAYLALQGGDLSKDYIRAIESAADCAAAKRMRDEFQASLEDMISIQPMLRKVTAGKNKQPRIDAIMACFSAP